MDSNKERDERLERRLAAESARAVSSRESSLTDWRTPAAGLWPARRGEFLTLWADFRERRAKPIDPSAIFAALHRLLGDHQVRLFSVSVRGGQASHDAGWRRTQHGHQMNLKVSELAAAGRWPEVSEHAGGLRHIHCIATRGGGATQHTAWFLDLHQLEGLEGASASQRMWLAVAAQHISADTGPFCTEPAAHELSADVDFLVETFFSAVSASGTTVCGAGELITGSPRCWNAWTFDSGVRFGEDAINVEYVNGEPRYLYVAAYNLFGPKILKQLGGIKRLRSLVVDFDFRALPGGGELDWRLGYGRAMSARAIGRSCRLSVFPFNQRLEASANPQGHGVRQDLWVKNELARAELLIHQDTGWQAAAKESAAERRDQILREERRGAPKPQQAARPPIDWTAYLKHIRAQPPSCLRKSREVADLPWGCDLPDNCVLHQIGEGHGALPIYGVLIEPGLSGLGSPLLVGSLDRKRAACWFDRRVHGHDGYYEFDQRSLIDVRKGPKLSQLICPKCQGRLFCAWAQLEYPDDFEDFKQEPEYEEREELFTWFYLHAECAACKWHDEVASVECA